MAQNDKLRDLIAQTLSEFLQKKRQALIDISPDLIPLADFSETFLSGGKRFRALFAYWGWASVADHIFDPESVSIRNRKPILNVAAALELFQAAALLHDDLIDNSDTRRGNPSGHKHFEQLHTQEGWLGSGKNFGRSSALLLGDLILAWSEELFNDALDLIPDLIIRQTARQEFSRMRTEVTAGQYLDTLEEHVWNQFDSKDALDRAKTIIIYKSAKYSVVAPLRLGAILNGASEEQLRSLGEFGLPLGIAYQMRDDMLGVFGDTELTGKPSGDDLREGKRTVLIALTKALAAPAVGRFVDELLGDPEISEDQIALLQREITASGASERSEKLIQAQLQHAAHALDESPLNEDAIVQLRDLASRVAVRVS